MAILNTFEKCLDASQLFHDPEAPARVRSLLELATDRVEGAALVDRTGQGDRADVVLLCYEAMFACLRAVVYAQGYREAGLRCLLIACERLYVEPGKLDGGLLNAFVRAQGVKSTPAEALEAGRAWLSAAQTLVAPSPAGSTGPA